MNRVYEPSGPVTKAFLLDDSFVRGIMGPFGCVAGDTLVITEFGPIPIERINRPMRVLSWCEKSNQFVFSLSGGAYRKQRGDLYQISTVFGCTEVAGNHRLLLASGEYLPANRLSPGDRLAQHSLLPLLSSEAFARILSLSGVRHYSQRVVDYLGHYADGARQCDPQLLPEVGDGQSFAPSQGGAPECLPLPERGGGCLGLEQERSQHTLCGDRAASLETRGHEEYLPAYFSGDCVSRPYLPRKSEVFDSRAPASLDPEYHEKTACHRSETLADQVALKSPVLSGVLPYPKPSLMVETTILGIRRVKCNAFHWDMQVADTNNYVTIDGTIHHNSGKSVACCIDIFRRACEQKPNHDGVRRTRWAIIRNTYPELVTTTIKTWFDWISRDLGKYRSQGPPTHFLDFQLEDGTKVDAEVMFLALDSAEDVKKLLSLELTGAWVNECREVPESVIKALRGRVGRFPSQADGGQTWTGIILDTNPPDTDSWYYKLAEELQPKKHKFFRQPSGLAEDGENKQNLPPDYYENICVGADEDFIKVHVHGEYGFVMDGKPVYPEYKQSIHCQPLEKYKKAPLYIGIDFGLTPAAAICQKGPRGEWIVLDEVATDDMGAQRFAEVLKAFLNQNYHDHKMFIYGDPSGDNRAQTDETTPFMILRKNGIMAVPAPSNDPVQRKEALKAPLGRLIDGIPGIRIAPHCERINKGLMGGYHYKRMRVSGKDKFKDLPEKNMYSHIIEALEYAMLGAGEGKGIFGGSHTPKNLPYNNKGIV